MQIKSESGWWFCRLRCHSYHCCRCLHQPSRRCSRSPTQTWRTRRQDGPWRNSWKQDFYNSSRTQRQLKSWMTQQRTNRRLWSRDPCSTWVCSETEWLDVDLYDGEWNKEYKIFNIEFSISSQICVVWCVFNRRWLDSSWMSTQSPYIASLSPHILPLFPLSLYSSNLSCLIALPPVIYIFSFASTLKPYWEMSSVNSLDHDKMLLHLKITSIAKWTYR